jgi:hypothetical protein
MRELTFTSHTQLQSKLEMMLGGKTGNLKKTQVGCNLEKIVSQGSGEDSSNIMQSAHKFEFL